MNNKINGVVIYPHPVEAVYFAKADNMFAFCEEVLKQPEYQAYLTKKQQEKDNAKS